MNVVTYSVRVHCEMNRFMSPTSCLNNDSRWGLPVGTSPDHPLYLFPPLNRICV